MTDKELQRAERAFRTATARAEERRATRNAAVRAAVAAGWTHARIADALGVTRGRVGQLAAGDD